MWSLFAQLFKNTNMLKEILNKLDKADMSKKIPKTDFAFLADVEYFTNIVNINGSGYLTGIYGSTTYNASTSIKIELDGVEMLHALFSLDQNAGRGQRSNHPALSFMHRFENNLKISARTWGDTAEAFIYVTYVLDPEE